MQSTVECRNQDPNPTQENTGQTLGPSGLDLNVEPAWMQGITGDGVVVGIVDDGQLECSIHNGLTSIVYMYGLHELA